MGGCAVSGRRDRTRAVVAVPVEDVTGAPGCPCCGEWPWCREEIRAAVQEVESAPEIVIGSAPVAGRVIP